MARNVNDFNNRSGKGGFEKLLEVRDTKKGELRVSVGYLVLIRGHLPDSIAGFSSIGKFMEEFCVTIPCLELDYSAFESPQFFPIKEDLESLSLQINKM